MNNKPTKEHQKIKDFFMFMNHLGKAGLQNAFINGNLIKSNCGYIAVKKEYLI